VAAFNLQAKEGQDPDLKAFAAEQLPVLQEHLKRVRTLATQHATGKGTEATGQRGKK
jgi:putative membrane protein